ncbi:MAG: hypothetical protein VKK42_21055 [Lyngbya sp.]|nr:hypothetical protein [Lyngbya sp.]
MADLFLNLGIDFGTSFTKVCVRDTDRERSWVVNFAGNRPRLDEALLPTKIGICNDGRLLAGLTQSEWVAVAPNVAVSIDFIKMRLANLDVGTETQPYPSDRLQSFKRVDLNTTESLENLSAYYLSRVITKAQDWVMTNNQTLVKNQEIGWSANVGVPVKYIDSKAVERFKRVIRWAWLLCQSQPQSFNDLWEEMERLRGERDRDDIPCFAMPEIAAAVQSYTISRQAEPGTYIFFDIGSGTIEGASFRFWREPNMPPLVEFYSAEVEALGVNALAKKIAAQSKVLELDLTRELIEDSQTLLSQVYSFSETLARPASKTSDRRGGGGERVANKILVGNSKVFVEDVELQLQKASNPETQKLLHLILAQNLIHREVATVIVGCQKKFPSYFQQSPKLGIFLGGGGRNIEYYRETIESTYIAFGHKQADIPVYQLKELPFPADFDLSRLQPNNLFHRFAIAYGLSVPEGEGPEIKGYPRQFPDAPPPPPRRERLPQLPTD